MRQSRRRSHARRSWLMAGLVLVALCRSAAPIDAQSTIAFVQVNSAVPQSPQSVVTTIYSGAQTAGNLNVVVVAWNDTTAQVQSVVDSTGNTYAAAVGPTVRSGLGTQTVYYAKNIAASPAGSNTVTVTFNLPANYVDLRIAEYRGLDPVNPVDVVVAGQGSSTSSNSGTATTTSANALLVGANLVATRTSNAGTSYTKRIITVPDGDILEDRVVSATASYNATAPLSPSGPWIMQMVAFRGAPTGPPDAQAPTAPATLVATAQSGTQINLSWTASTDNVGVSQYLIERCQGAGCTTFAQVGTATGTTFSNTGLTPATSYSYRVRAADAAGNQSGYSPNGTAATPDTVVPTTPGSVVATVVSDSLVDLSWAASTDNVGVTQYLIERCQGSGCATFVQIATAPGSPFANTALAASTVYRYRLRATDAAGNLSGYSAIVTATTLAAPDTQAPTAPAGLTGIAVSASQINLSWPAATDNVGVTQYWIERCQGAGCATFAQLATTAALTFSNTGLTSGTSYTYRVRASDAAANLGSYSPVASATTQSPDTQAPTAPSGLSANATSSSQVTLAWTASTDNVGVTSYLVERCQGVACASFAQIGTSATLAYTDNTASASTSHSYRVRASDAANNLSTYSNVASATTPAAPDTQAPTTPSGLAASAPSAVQVTLSWAGSTDNVGVTNYLVERCIGAGCASFAQIGTSPTASYSDTSVSASNSYGYRVRATDAASNLSGYSNTASVTTPAVPDTEVPTPPASLTATAVSNGQINLAWTAATDNVGVTQYLIERCQGVGCTTFAQVATAAGTTSSDTGLSGGTSYSYRVRARDAASNQGPYSPTASATTPAAPAIAFVQSAYAVPQSPVATVPVALTQPQTVGNLNVVVVGWNSPAGQVQTVADTAGNTYVRAVGPTVQASFATQSIYYAANIAAAATNTVTVTFSGAMAYPDIRVAEYSGLAPVNPVDGVAAAFGDSALSDSGAVVTTNATDLLVGANMVSSLTTGPGAGFTNRVITVPDGDILEDRIVTAPGTYNATAPLWSAPWIMQVVAFKAAPTGPDTQAPTAPTALSATATSSTQITLAWSASSDNVGVTQYLIERCPGSGCSSFVQVATSTAATFPDSGLAPSMTYQYRVRAIDGANNLSSYSNVAFATTFAPPDTQAPTAPATLTATAAVSGTQVDLAWTAATDNVGVTQYLIERCQGAGCTTFGQIATATGTTLSNTGLTPATSYSYRVRATDAAANLGGYSPTATAATPDTVAPATPGSAAATAISDTRVDVSWTASTDNVAVTQYLIERCQGAGCTTFAQVGTATGSPFGNTGLAASTVYRYRVRATDAAGNLSGYTAIVTATTLAAPDTQAPTAPATLTATAMSGTQVDLTWTAATDNVGVTQYLIERCQGAGCTTLAQIATATGTTFSNTGLTAGTSYSYRVRATDAASNQGPYSPTASATTPAPDTQAPTAPANLTATAVSSGQINLAWTAATDNVGVTNYLIERCQGVGCTTFAQVATATGTTSSDTGLSGGTSYGYRVRATDAASNQGPYSPMASATTTAAPGVAFVQQNSAVPQSPVATVPVPFLQAQTAGNLNVVVVGWNASTGTVQSVTDGSGNTYVRAVGPTVRLGFATQSIYYAANIAAAPANTVTVIFSGAVPYPDIRIAEYSGVAPVNPVDGVAAAFGDSALSDSGSVTTTSGTALLVAGNMVSSMTTGPGAGFTDRVITAPDGDILEDRVVTAPGTYTATAPLWSAPWIMQVVAFKAGQAAPDTEAPTAPTGLSATAVSGTQVNLTWTAATDNVAVTNYLIERCQGASCAGFSQIGTSPTPGYTDSTTVASTSYSYRVRATDAAANQGAYSNTATATTLSPDIESPSAPGTLTATATSGTQIEVSWGAATDNVGVTGYRLERCQGAGCTAFTKFGFTITGTSYSDSGLSLDTSYSYIVRAQDAAGNLGTYSNVGSAQTLTTNPFLVAAYSFDEGAGSNVADLSGYANSGSIANATWTTAGKFGKALVFNGSNAMVTIPDSASLRLTSGMTLEAWVNPTVVNTGWKDIIYKGNDNYYLEGATPSGPPMAGITVGAAQAETFGTAALPANTWTFLAATYDGTTLRFFVNGTQVSNTPRTGSIITSSNPMQIGGDSIWGQFFQGIIDEVRVYNVALTPGQIQADMAIAVGGSSPALSLSSLSSDFGSQPVGTPSAPRTITVTNGGTVTLNISSIAVSGAQASDFVQSNNCVGSVAPFASCTMTVTFTPANAGARSASIVISNNAPGNPHTVTLTGVGTGFGVSPQTAVATPGQTQQFTVSGPGSGSVIWLVDSLVGGSAASGTITTTGLYTPPATAGSHSVRVATTDGSQNATATVHVTTSLGMLTHHNDDARTGQNLNETALSLANVNSASFGKIAEYSIDGIAHASPLYVANVNIPGVGLKNVVYVATEHNSVYAFDADARTATPLWQRSFINPGAGITTVPNGDTGECCDIAPEIGITGTPVIDAATQTLYVVVKTKEGVGNYPQRLHALDLATGAEKFGGPVLIQASVPGTGTGSSNGQLPFDSLRENQRTALLLRNGTVYMGFGSHGDYQPYHGWLLGYNATTLQRTFVFNATPNGEGGGIWQSGGGLAMDAAGNFFFATGDGTFNRNLGGVDYGDTFLKLSPTGTVMDWFTPRDEGNINNNNLDLDAGGMILLPDQPGPRPRLLVSAGKDGTIYVVDRDSMGGFHTAGDQNVQTLQNIFPFGTPLPGNYSSPVYFNGAIYFGPVSDVVQMFRLTNGLLSTAPTSTTAQAFAYPGASLAISANGTTNGILWAVQKNGGAAGTLRAYDASNLAIELYNSDQAGARDRLDVAAKFSIPLVINGRVYVASEGKLTIFSILP